MFSESGVIAADGGCLVGFMGGGGPGYLTIGLSRVLERGLDIFMFILARVVKFEGMSAIFLCSKRVKDFQAMPRVCQRNVCNSP